MGIWWADSFVVVLRDLPFQEHKELNPERIPGTQRTKDPFSSGFVTTNATTTPTPNVTKNIYSAPLEVIV